MKSTSESKHEIQAAVDAYLANHSLSEEESEHLLRLAKEPESTPLPDLVMLSRRLPVHFHAQKMNAQIKERVLRGILVLEAKKEARLLRVAKGLQVAAVLLSILVCGSSVYLLQQGYAHASSVDQMRMLFSLSLSLAAVGLSLATHQVAYIEARIRLWITGVWRMPTLMDVLVLRAEALALIALIFLLAHI